MQTRKQTTVEILALEQTLYATTMQCFKTLQAAETLPTLTSGITNDTWLAILENLLLPELEKELAKRILKRAKETGSLEAALQGEPNSTPEIIAIIRKAIYEGAQENTAYKAYEIPGVKDWQTIYLQNVKNRLVGIPESIFEEINKATQTAITNGENPNEAQKTVQKILEDTNSQIWKNRAKTIAQTEAVGAYNAATLQAAKLREIYLQQTIKKQWLCTLDGRTRPSHTEADGQTVDLDQPFNIGGHQLQHPGDPKGNAGQVINCRCTMLEVEVEETINKTNRQNPQPITATIGANTMQTFSATLAPINTISRDSRIIAENAQITAQTPIPLLWQQQTNENHNQAFTIGIINTITIEDNQIKATGTLLDTPQTNEAKQQIENQITKPSIDIAGEEWELDEETGIITYNALEIIAATLVPKPAFRETQITLTNEASETKETTQQELTASTRKEYEYAHFTDPKLTKPTQITLNETTGRITGHLATWNTCHTGSNQCIKPPHTKTNYALFHTGTINTTKGTLNIGKLTTGIGHAQHGLALKPATSHYDNTGTAFAIVRAGEDNIGIWISGVVAPWATQEQIEQGLSSPLSGDWRAYGGNLELVAALAVNAPGFPIPKGSTKRGKQYALVAANVIQQQPVQEKDKATVNDETPIKDTTDATNDSVGTDSDATQSTPEAPLTRDEIKQLIIETIEEYEESKKAGSVEEVEVTDATDATNATDATDAVNQQQLAQLKQQHQSIKASQTMRRIKAKA